MGGGVSREGDCCEDLQSFLEHALFFSSGFSLAVKLINKGSAGSFLGCLEKGITGKKVFNPAAEHSTSRAEEHRLKPQGRLVSTAVLLTLTGNTLTWWGCGSPCSGRLSTTQWFSCYTLFLWAFQKVQHPFTTNSQGLGCLLPVALKFDICLWLSCSWDYLIICQCAAFTEHS